MTLRRHPSRGFSLVEVTLALGVAGFALIAVLGLLPIGLQTNRTATEHTAAPKILSAVAADLRGTPATGATSARFSIEIPATSSSSSSTIYFTEDGTHSTSLASGSRYRVVVSFAPNSAGQRAATFAHVKITWPAAADPSNAEGRVENFVALVRN